MIETSQSELKILFVCLGNICRSPTAEAVFRARASGAGLNFLIDSAGTGAWHTGEAPDARAVSAGTARGYDFSGQTARKVRVEDFEIFDYVLAMDARNQSDLIKICPQTHHHKIKRFLDYAPDLSTRDVPDPYYGGPDGFDHVLKMVEAASDGLIQHLKMSKSAPESKRKA